MAKIKVTNAVGTTENGVNQIERYFRDKYNIQTPKSWECITCGQKIVRKDIQLMDTYWEDENTMVGGHLEDREGNLYLAPMCKACNDKKENLEIIGVNKDYLLPI